MRSAHRWSHNQIIKPQPFSRLTRWSGANLCPGIRALHDVAPDNGVPESHRPCPLSLPVLPGLLLLLRGAHLMDAARARNLLQPPCNNLCPIRRCTAEGEVSWVASSVHCICRSWGSWMRHSMLAHRA